MNSMKLGFNLIAHGAVREIKDRETKQVTARKVPCLFIRFVDKEIGEVMNQDGTYPSTDVLNVSLDENFFKSVNPKSVTYFVCDSYAINGNELVVARKIRIGDQFVSLKSEDVKTDKVVSAT